MAIATIAMVGCKPKDEPQQTGGDDPTPVTEKEDAPMLSDPGAGFVTIALRVPATTPGQVYAIGAFANAKGEDNGWSHAKDYFTKVEGTETWQQITLTYAADMAVKVCAVPAVGTPDWSYQWGMNTEEKENVTIVSGDVTLDNSENSGEVKALNLVDGKVVYIDVDAWKTNPDNKKGKATVAAIKYAPDWVFKPMEAKGDGVFTYEMVYAENGVNIADNLEGNDANWYPTENIVNYTESGVERGDSVRFTFTSEAGSVGVVSIEIIKKAEAPTEFVDGFFYINAGEITAPNIYCFGATELFGVWPGAALTEKENELYKIAYHAVKDGEYHPIINGNEGQTNDGDAIVLTGQDVMVTVGAKDGEKYTITVADKN